MVSIPIRRPWELTRKDATIGTRLFPYHYLPSRTYWFKPPEPRRPIHQGQPAPMIAFSPVCAHKCSRYFSPQAAGLYEDLPSEDRMSWLLSAPVKFRRRVSAMSSDFSICGRAVDRIISSSFQSLSSASLTIFHFEYSEAEKQRDWPHETSI
ncbi:unnamed protein product [Cyclocybe aegerita]|uniref:Uncharacterized protein n=1 Tax=Cyclocybe aegerita TaxID=1973307 RepID=A0A8S0W054_CYCAE|nr:unnamed protein product [Cyclocybe aegerita]